MADTKITALTEDTSPSTDDFIVTVDDPGGSPVNKKAKLDNLPVSTPTQDALDLKADDADVVHDTGAESVAGVKTFTDDPIIPDEAYGVGWNGVLEPPTKNAVYDKIETLGVGYTDEQAQDAVGTILADSTSIDFTYTDGTPEITAAVKDEAIQDIVGAMVSGGTETGISVSYDDTNARLDFVAEVTQSEIDAKANDADVVHDTGAETVAGVKTFSDDPIIPDEAYGSGWNGVLEPPTKNAVYDKIEALGGLAYKLQMTYTFDNSTSMADPGSGKFRLDNALRVFSLNIAIDDVDAGGTDQQAIFGQMGNIDSIYFVEVGDITKYARYSLTAAPTEFSGYWTLPVQFTDGAVSELTNGATYLVMIVAQRFGYRRRTVATDILWDAVGDIAVGSGADTATKLAKGTAGQWLHMNSDASAVEWETNRRSGGSAPSNTNPIYETAAWHLNHTNLGSALTSGRISFIPIWLDEGFVPTNISFYSGTTAAVTPTNQWFCIAELTGVVRAVTADDTSTAWASNSTKTLAVATAAWAVPSSGVYFIGIMVAAGTVPTLRGLTTPGGGSIGDRSLKGDSGLTTPPSAGTDIITGGTASQNFLFAGVY